MKSYFLLFFALLCGCATNMGNTNTSQIAWDFRTTNSGKPQGKVFLKVKGESYQIISQARGYYRQLEREEFDDYGIPSNTLIAAKSWYAGFGDLLIVIKKSNQLEVYRQETDEREDSNYPAEKVTSIPL